MATYVASNFATSLLVGSIDTVATSITVTTGQGTRFPVVNNGGTGTEYTLITLQNASGDKEIVCVVRHDTGTDVMTIGVAGTVVGSVSGRAQEGTTVASWTTLTTTVACRPTAAIVASGANAAGLSQPLDADLTAIAALTSAADKVPYSTGASAWALATLTAFGRSLIAAVDQAAARVVLALTPGVDVQAYDAQLSSRIRQRSLSAAATVALTDAGGSLFHPAADTTARTWTIDSNANVAMPVDSAVTFVNQYGAGVITIAITADTLRWAGVGSTGSRTLAAGGMATALKITSTEWMISGAGLS